MSRVGELSRVAIFLADYAAADAVQKVNALGVGWSVTPIDPQTGITAPHAVVVLIDSPPAVYGDEFAVTLTLRGSDDRPVMVPGPAGQPTPMRMSQTARVEIPVFPPEMNIPHNTLWAHTQVIMHLGGGIPLTPGALYTWTLEIDSNKKPYWAASFYVPGPRQGPVFGGPANPSTIPEIGDPVTDAEHPSG